MGRKVMFNKAARNVIIDLLFNLLLSFVVLFFLAFLMITKKDEEEKANTQNDNHILVMMRWSTNNDIDLCVRLPDGRRVGYNNRDEPPVHLDVDVVRWRQYQDGYGNEHTITTNEEITTIRDVLAGEYVVNIHYYSKAGLEDPTTEVEILIQDVQHRKVLFAGTKTVTVPNIETHVVRFTVNDEGEDSKGKKRFSVSRIFDDRPSYFLGRGARE